VTSIQDPAGIRILPWHARALVALLLLIFLTVGLTGIDFGYHWDEPLLVWQIRDSIENKLLLPTGRVNEYWPSLKGGNYEYPMVLYWIGIASALPEIIHRGVIPTGPATAITDHYRFQFRLRCECLAITSLTLIWVYLAAKKVVRRPGAAVFAAALVAGSWEYAYHARFVATDTVMAQFAGGVLVLCLGAIRATNPVRQRRWLIAAAIVAGIATGTKYPGGMLAVPLIAAGWLSTTPAVPRKLRLKRVGKLFALQVGVFLFTTPGIFLQPWNFGAWVWYDHIHYGFYGHGAHTIRNHVAHLSAIVQFLSLTLFSPSAFVSVPIALLCVLGSIRLLWTDRRAAAIVLLFPALYILYFATQVAEIVRNLLVLVPFLVVAGAVGVDMLFDGLQRLHGRVRSIGTWGLTAGLTGAILFSLTWQCMNVYAIHTRPHTNPVRFAAFQAYIAKHPDLSVYPTDQAARVLNLPLFPPNPGPKPVVVGFSHEDGTTLYWPSNIFHYAIATFGTPEVNFDDYADWAEDAIVLVDLDAARRVTSEEVERAVGRYERSKVAPSGFVLGPYLAASGPIHAERDGIAIQCVHPALEPMPYISAAPLVDGSLQWIDPQAIAFEITGLLPGKRYVIGWSWWDVGHGNRRQSATIEPFTGGPPAQLVPPTALPEWTADQKSWHWPPPPSGAVFTPQSAVIPPAVYPDGRCRLILRRETGANAEASSVWIDVPKP
jgi:hypothetical protein